MAYTMKSNSHNLLITLSHNQITPVKMLLTLQIIVKVKYYEIIHKQCGTIESVLYG